MLSNYEITVHLTTKTKTMKTKQKMRNPDLDKTLPIDKNICELMTDNKGNYRLINGRKIYEIKGEDQNTRDLNLIINRVIASGMRPSEYLKQTVQ